MSRVNSNADDNYHYQFSYSLDRDRCLRLECANCGLPFKIKINPDDLTTLLAPEFKRIEPSIEIKEAQDSSKIDQLGCPYCDHVDEYQNMIDKELSLFLQRWVEREIIYPQMKKFYSDLGKSSSRNRSKKGLFRFEVKIETAYIQAPTRPIAGPSLPDMLKVDFLCCGERAKILENWRGAVNCPFCLSQTLLT